MRLPFIFLCLLILSCQHTPGESTVASVRSVAKDKVKETFTIQPLGKVDKKYIAAIQAGIEKFYGLKVIVNAEIPLTADLQTPSKLRYSADKILAKFRGPNHKLVLTQVDISTKDSRSPEWGIFGLGDVSGTICTVSTFRIRKNVSESVVLERLVKICLHEIGHNYGLNHCTRDNKCMMSAAQGTIKQVDNERIYYFCDYCLDFVIDIQEKGK